jgi:hypothetical protein
MVDILAVERPMLGNDDSKRLPLPLLFKGEFPSMFPKQAQ